MLCFLNLISALEADGMFRILPVYRIYGSLALIFKILISKFVLTLIRGVAQPG
jgi:hypothetical protein